VTAVTQCRSRLTLSVLLILMAVSLTGFSSAVGQSATTISRTTTVTGMTSSHVNYTALVLARQPDKPCTYSTTRMQGVDTEQTMALDIMVRPANATSQPAVVDFYIFNATQFKTFESKALSTNECAVGGAKVQVRGVLRYHVNFTFSPGDVFVFANLSSDKVGLVSMVGSLTVPYTATIIMWQASGPEENQAVVPRQISQLLILVGFIGLISFVTFRILMKRRTGSGGPER
jgi:uncharacterized membrane protein